MADGDKLSDSFGGEGDNSNPSELEKEVISEASDAYDNIMGGNGSDNTPPAAVVISDDDDKGSILENVQTNESITDVDKEVERRAQINDFIIEWTHVPNFEWFDVANRLGMAHNRAFDYTKEFMAVMEKASDTGKYPNDVLKYFNSTKIPTNRRLTPALIMAIENPIVKLIKEKHEAERQALNNNDGDISTDDMAFQQNQQQVSQNIGAYVGGPQGGSGRIQQLYDPDDIGDNVLSPNSHTITQLINFGLKKFNDIPPTSRKYIMDLIRSNKIFYSTNQMALRDLLASAIKHQPTVNSFMIWLENSAMIYLLPGEPFYRMNPMASMMPGAGVDPNFNMNPNSPVNMMANHPMMNPVLAQIMANLPPQQQMAMMQSLMSNGQNDEDQRAARADAQLDREIARMSKMMTMGMLQNYMGGGNGANGAALGGVPGMGGGMGPGGMDTTQYFLNMGYRPSEVIQPDGTKRTEWLPPYAQGGGGQGGPFQSVESVISLVSSIVNLTQNKGDGGINEAVTKFMLDRAMVDPLQQMLTVKQSLDQIGGLGGNRNPTLDELKLNLEMVKVGNEKEFGMKQLEMQSKERERQEMRDASHEEQSNQNIAMLMKFVPGLIQNFATPIIQKIFGNQNQQNAQQVAPQQPLMPPVGGAGMTMAPPPPGGKYDKRLLKMGVPLGGILSPDEYVDPQNGPTKSAVQEQTVMENRTKMQQDIENNILHRVNMSKIRNETPPMGEPEYNEGYVIPPGPTQVQEWSKDDLLTMNDQQLAMIGQKINNERARYETSINDYNDVIMLRQQQRTQNQAQQRVISDDDFEQPPQPQPQQYGAPNQVISEEDYHKKFQIPSGMDMNSDGLDSNEPVISEEDYNDAISDQTQQGKGGHHQSSGGQNLSDDLSDPEV